LPDDLTAQRSTHGSGRQDSRSVEFKHQNISAVLDVLGLPWIPGYKPKRNYQSAIFGAIDRYLTEHPDILQGVPKSPPAPPVPEQVFVSPPTVELVHSPVPELLRRLIRKFDPVERDLRNRSLGKAGEQFVVELERRQLIDADRSDLARKVRWVSVFDGYPSRTETGRAMMYSLSTRRVASACWK
jgi:hypothetical protein